MAASYFLQSTSPSSFMLRDVDLSKINSKESVWKPPWLEVQELAQMGQCGSPQVSYRNQSSTVVGKDSIRDTGYRDTLTPYLSEYPPGHHWQLEKALQFLRQSSNVMEWVSVDFFQILHQCVENMDLLAAKEIHVLLAYNGFDLDSFIVCHLIRTYSLLDDLLEAAKVFLKACKPSASSWGAIISAHANLGYAHQALDLYKQMKVLNIEPDGYVFAAVLKACTSLKEGKTVHTDFVKHGLQANTVTGSFLIDMYVNCASLEEATIVFQALPRRNVVSWNALIAGYVNNGQESIAIELFYELEQGGHSVESPYNALGTEQFVSPDAITYLHVLKACSNLSWLDPGHYVHANIIAKGVGSDSSIGNTLIDMYGKCGSINDARIVFDTLPSCDVVSWSILISGHSQHGKGSEALMLFEQMQQEKAIQPDQFAFVCALKACSMQSDLHQGRGIHKDVIVRGLEADDFVVSSLVDMYSKCGSCSDARSVFDWLESRNLVMWNAMISGYVQYGEIQEALKLFQRMRQACIIADQATYVSVLKACSSLSAFQKGLEIHTELVEGGFDHDLFISTTLIDFYSQFGNVGDAYRIFNKIAKPDVVSWNALIATCAQHNEYQLAVAGVKDMQHVGVSPNHATFVCVLSVYSHAGFINEGCAFFRSMRDGYGIVPTLEHFDSMVDLLGHGGCLEEAEDLLETLPFTSNCTNWTSLLSSCRTHNRTHGKLSIAKRCFDTFVTMERANAAGYTLMSNIYAHEGMQRDAEEIELLRKYANAWKKPAKAYIELDSHIYEFSVGDETHPRSKEIYEKLEALTAQMDEMGRSMTSSGLGTDARLVDEEKSLCGHCEKLAIAFGLICTPSGTTIRVSKNLRVCNDCHNASKMISKIEMREIVIADTFRRHHFKDGGCSCNDNY